MLLHLGVFFHFGSTEHPGKNDTKQRLGQDCPNEGGGGRRGFIEAINVCVREKGSRHTKYHVIESYREKREWKMFATKKVMKTAAEEATEISRFLPTPLQTPLGT